MSDIQLSQGQSAHEKLEDVEEVESGRRSMATEGDTSCSSKLAGKFIDLINPKLKTYSKPLLLAFLIGILTYSAVGGVFYKISVDCADVTEIVEGKNGIFDLMNKVNNLKSQECLYHTAKFSINLESNKLNGMYKDKTCEQIDQMQQADAAASNPGGGGGDDNGGGDNGGGGGGECKDITEPGIPPCLELKTKYGCDSPQSAVDPGAPSNEFIKDICKVTCGVCTPGNGRRRLLADDDQDPNAEKTIAERNITLCKLAAVTNFRFFPCRVPLTKTGTTAADQQWIDDNEGKEPKTTTVTITDNALNSTGQLRYCPGEIADPKFCADEKGAIYVIKQTVCPSYVSALGAAFGYAGLIELVLTAVLVIVLMQLRIIQKDNAEMRGLFAELWDAKADIKDLGETSTGVTLE